MADIKDGRKLVSVTMTPPLYDELVSYCRSRDIQVSPWVRQLIQRELQTLQAESHETQPNHW